MDKKGIIDSLALFIWPKMQNLVITSDESGITVKGRRTEK